jgi:hypothetical protein
MKKTWRFTACLAVLIAAGAPAQGERWTFAVGEDAENYETMASLSQAAGNTIKDESATKDVTPVLAIRCRPGSPDLSVRIDWQRFISSFNTEVSFKVDGGKALWQKWGVDRSNKITSTRSAGDTAALLGHLGEGASLEVEIAPYSEPAVSVTFDLAGLGDGLARLSEECA